MSYNVTYTGFFFSIYLSPPPLHLLSVTSTMSPFPLYPLSPSVTSSHIPLPVQWFLNLISILCLLCFSFTFNNPFQNIYCCHPCLSVSQSVTPVQVYPQSHQCLLISACPYGDFSIESIHVPCFPSCFFGGTAQIITEMTSLPLCLLVI